MPCSRLQALLGFFGAALQSLEAALQLGVGELFVLAVLLLIPLLEGGSNGELSFADVLDSGLDFA